MKGLVAWTTSHWALSAAAFGDCQNAKQKATQALQNSQDAAFSGSMTVFALCGDAAHAEAHVKRFAAQYPNDTRLNGIWVPLTHAALELQRGQPSKALELLAPVTRYEAAADFQPQYLRGLCYLRLGKSAEAATEFQKILNSQGQTDFLVSTLYPLARLGLARGCCAATATWPAAWRGSPVHFALSASTPATASPSLPGTARTMSKCSTRSGTRDWQRCRPTPVRPGPSRAGPVRPAPHRRLRGRLGETGDVGDRRTGGDRKGEGRRSDRLHESIDTTISSW